MTSATTSTGAVTARRYLSLAFNVLIWIIVAIDAWYLWPTALHGSTSMVVVSGHSMDPTYFTGDLVIARKIEPSVGDVIVYAPEGFGGSQIVHRIVGGDAQDGWVMQGDNNPRVDPFTPTGDEVKGVVLVHYANFGRVTVLLLNPIMWALVLIAAIVLLVWWSGDSCEDDPDDEDKKENDRDPEAEVEEEPDLIDRMVEGTEAALARMVTSGAAAGAAALALWKRRWTSPHHAAPAYVRGFAIVAVFGLVAMYGPSTAWASSLAINTGGGIFTKTYAPCTTATLGVTYSGTVTGGTSYPSIAITGLAGCAGLALSYTLYGGSGPIVSGNNIPVVAGTNVISTGVTYDASQVSSVFVSVNAWPIANTWTPPALPIKCEELTAYTGSPGDGVMTSGVPTGNACTLSYKQYDAWGGTPPKHFNLYFTVSGATTGNWRVTINFADPYFQGLLPTSLTGNGNPLAAPGYVCGNLPVFVGQANLTYPTNTRMTGYLAGDSVGGSSNLC